MSARGRALSGLVTVVMSLAGFATVGALPAAGVSDGNVEYVALGDSYAAGTAAGSYPNCQRSTAGYPALLVDIGRRIDLQANVTCSGATTSSVATTQLSALNRDTRLVTVTVGAADLGLTRVLTACTPVPPSDDCDDAINDALALFVVGPEGESVLGNHLASLFAEVVDEAPKALVVVTGYPLLFASPAPGTLNEDIINQVNAATILLNDAIKQAVEATQAPGVDIVYVDVTEAFEEHGIGGQLQPFINPPGTADAFHPTAAGYIAYADAISATLPKAWLDKQKKSA
jgi:lysophospholipase L1-like esterase